MSCSHIYWSCSHIYWCCSHIYWCCSHIYVLSGNITNSGSSELSLDSEYSNGWGQTNTTLFYIIQNTSLAVKGALAHRLQRRTA